MTAGTKKEGNYNVILAEDNALHQRLVREFLKKFDINLSIVNNGKELLERLAENRIYDLVLLDIQMPIMDGYTVTEAIRKNPKYKDLIIVGLTAFAMEGDERYAMIKGMNDYITKPFSQDTLVKTLSRYLVLRKL
jgi:two-component system, sensor histidine kinase and response regulator